MSAMNNSSQLPQYPAIRFNTQKTERELADFSRQALMRAAGGRKAGWKNLGPLSSSTASNPNSHDNHLYYERRQHILASIAETEIILRRIFS